MFIQKKAEAGCELYASPVLAATEHSRLYNLYKTYIRPSMPRRTSPLRYKQLKYGGNLRIEAYLRDLAKTGLYGGSDGEAAARLISQGIERAIRDGIIKRYEDSPDSEAK